MVEFVHSLRILIFGVCIITGIVIIAEAQEPNWTFDTPGEITHISMSSNGSSVLFSGDRLYLFSKDGIKIWEGWEGSKALITSDGAYIAAATDGGLRYLTRSGESLWVDAKYRPITDIALSPTGFWIATLADNYLTKYSNGGEVIFRTKYSDTKSIAIPLEGEPLVIGMDNEIRLLSFGGRKLWNLTIPTPVMQVAISNDGKTITATGQDKVFCFNRSGMTQWEYSCGNVVEQIQNTPSGLYYVVGSRDGYVHLLNATGRLIWKYQSLGSIRSVGISSNGGLIAAGGNDNTIYVFNITGNLQWTYRMRNPIQAVAVSADGTTVAAAGTDGKAVIFVTSQTTVVPTYSIVENRTVRTPTTAPIITRIPETTPQSALAYFLPVVAWGIISMVWVFRKY